MLQGRSGAGLCLSPFGSDDPKCLTTTHNGTGCPLHEKRNRICGFVCMV